jgi:hypothetical protein
MVMKLLSNKLRDELNSIKENALYFLPMALLIFAYGAFGLAMIVTAIVQLSGALGSC